MILYWKFTALIADHSCAIGYDLTEVNKICGTVAEGSPGEINVGGPNWPSESISKLESEEACAKECNERPGCTHYIWFDDKGCRTQTSCSQSVSNPYQATVSSFVCMKGIFVCFCNSKWK